MAKYNLNKIKKISQEASKPVVLNLGKFLGETMEGITLPFRIRTYEETLKLKNKYKLESGLATLKYVEFSKADKNLREFYEKSIPSERKSISRFVYICDAVADGGNLEILKFKERILEVVLNVDMDSVSESGKTLWEDLEIEKEDYVSLVNTFSNVIKYEEELIVLEAIVNVIKSGLRDEMQILIRVQIQNDLRKIMAIEDESVREKTFKDYQDGFTKVQKSLEKTAKSVDKKIKKANVSEANNGVEI
jgi:soluble cytochrome b562